MRETATKRNDTKGTVNAFSNLFIRKTCTVGVMKSNGEARLFSQEVLEWHLE